MGIVFKQSLRNTLIIYIAFAIGGVNALFLYTYFLKDEYYGLVTFLLSTANLLMPLTAFGVQYVIVKFYSSYKSKIEQDQFLSSALLLPLFIALPIGFIGTVFYEQISNYLSLKNEVVKEYTFVIYWVALFTAYFEIFYSWAKVQMQTVFGNLVKEMFSRVAATILLFLIYLKLIDKEQFICLLTFAYFIRMLVMMSYAFYLRKPKITFELPNNYKEIIQYSFYIILVGSAGSILLDIDKVMIPQKEAIAQTAYYAVAVYIGSVIEAPGRAMSQIVQPITAKALNEKNYKEIYSLYKKTSINLFLISGLVFLLVNVNIKELYEIIPEKYAGGLWVVFMISIAKLYHMLLGNNGAIISNSKYYKILLPYALLMAVSVYFMNDWLIDEIGINGAAVSTLVVVLIFNSIKIWYVKKKFGLTPFSDKTWKLLIMLILFFVGFYFWEFPFHPILNILLKSILLGSLYLIVSIKLNIAPESIVVWERFKNYFLKNG
ncbi:MAG TPA: lipopolysaccharide biosynthesis protein [Lutibacter sp.]|nr:lipopolysaccharide biosynthesis protein [Lutibacter sp.]